MFVRGKLSVYFVDFLYYSIVSYFVDFFFYSISVKNGNGDVGIDVGEI